MADAQIPLTAEDPQAAANDPEAAKPAQGIGLCLSGGGYRAMVFHVGSIWRLNELGYLPKLSRVSSVSGGSITAGVLGMNWSRLTFDANGVATNLQDQLVAPILRLAGKTIDVEAVLGGIFLPGSIADKAVHALRSNLFGERTLQDLPPAPVFVINATNLQSGALLRFTRAYMWDYRVGEVKSPTVDLAVAVQASAAFPPVLAPATLKLKHSDFAPGTGDDLERAPFTTEMVLADGGVYDNLGLEPTWKRCDTVLVSDAGGKMAAEEHPHTDWVRLMMRVGDTVDNQVRSLRKRQLIAAFEGGQKTGAYWGVRSDIRRYFPPAGPLPGALDCPLDRTMDLAGTPTRLQEMAVERQRRLVNWGYAICDAAMRRHLALPNAPVASFPFPGGV